MHKCWPLIGTDSAAWNPFFYMLALATGRSWAIAKKTVQGVYSRLGDSSVAYGSL